MADAALNVVKTASTPAPVSGESFSYQVAVTNNGPSLAKDVKITDTLPSDVTYLYAVGATCSASGSQVTCSLGDLAVGQTKVFDIFVQVNADLLPDTLLTNVVTATTATTSTLWTSRVTVQAQSVADLAIRKFGKPDGEVRAGDTLTYTVIVDNHSPRCGAQRGRHRPAGLGRRLQLCGGGLHARPRRQRERQHAAHLCPGQHAAGCAAHLHGHRDGCRGADHQQRGRREQPERQPRHG